MAHGLNSMIKSEIGCNSKPHNNTSDNNNNNLNRNSTTNGVIIKSTMSPKTVSAGTGTVAVDGTAMKSNVGITTTQLGAATLALSTSSTTTLSSSTSVSTTTTSTVKMGSRRIFTAQFKLQVLDSYRTDNDCKGNQRATARKYGIHRRQIQKWLQVETNLRTLVANSINVNCTNNNNNNMNRNHSTNEPKVPLESTRHRVASNNTNINNNNNNIINNNSNNNNNSLTNTNNINTGYIISSPVPINTNELTTISFIHSHELSSSSSISLSSISSSSSSSTSSSSSSSLSSSSSSSSSSSASSLLSSASLTNLPKSPVIIVQNNKNNYNNYEGVLTSPTTLPVAPQYYEQQKQQHHHHQPYKHYYNNNYYEMPIDLSLHNNINSNDNNNNSRLANNMKEKVDLYLPTLTYTTIVTPPLYYDKYAINNNSIQTKSHLMMPNSKLEDTTDDINLIDISERKCVAWDLSCRKRRHTNDVDIGASDDKMKIKDDHEIDEGAVAGDDEEDAVEGEVTTVKLFKPYLLTDEEEEQQLKYKDKYSHPIIWSNHNNFYEHSSLYHHQHHHHQQQQQQHYNSYLYSMTPPSMQLSASPEIPYCMPTYPSHHHSHHSLAHHIHHPHHLQQMPATITTSTTPAAINTSTTSDWLPPQGSPVSGYDSSTSVSSTTTFNDNDVKYHNIDGYYHDITSW